VVTGVQTCALPISTSGTGSLSLNPAGGSYASGTVVTVTATAGSGWQFSGWSGALSGSTNPTTITMNANKAITATFTQITGTQYKLTVSITGQGTVSPNGGTFTSGTSVNLTATPATGYHFTSWSGGATGSTNPVAIVMNANKSVTALFEVNTTTGCANPVTISIPFTKDGVGNFCWVTSTPIAYVNSWNLTSLKINGVDFTNKWSNSLPASQNGQWFIEYSSAVSWGHFEAPQTKSGKVSSQTRGNSDILLFPNPFTTELSLKVENPEQVDRIVILDQLGRQVETIGHTAVKSMQTLGSSLKAGIYIVQVHGTSGLETFKVTKNQ
jgi:endoglucanase